MSKTKKMDALKKKSSGSVPIFIQSNNSKFNGNKIKNSFKEDEKKEEEVEFIVGSYNPDKHYSFLKEMLNEQREDAPSDLGVVGEKLNNYESQNEMSFNDIFDDLE